MRALGIEDVFAQTVPPASVLADHHAFDVLLGYSPRPECEHWPDRGNRGKSCAADVRTSGAPYGAAATHGIDIEPADSDTNAFTHLEAANFDAPSRSSQTCRQSTPQPHTTPATLMANLRLVDLTRWPPTATSTRKLPPMYPTGSSAVHLAVGGDGGSEAVSEAEALGRRPLDLLAIADEVLDTHSNIARYLAKPRPRGSSVGCR